MADAFPAQALRIAIAAFLCVVMAGCASVPGDSGSSAPPPLAASRGGPGRIETPPAPLQCVPYARAHSGISIYGDAGTWWNQATNKYARHQQPEPGAVMVLIGYAGPKRGHLAVVQKIVSPRLILVDHANWLNSGDIYLSNAVADVSPANDWSVVRVYNLRADSWGIRDYPVQGFIGPEPAQMRLAGQVSE
jgi:hypothetical protein